MNSYEIKKIISRSIPNTNEGLFLRQLIFNNSTILPADGIIEDLIKKYFPELKQE